MGTTFGAPGCDLNFKLRTSTAKRTVPSSIANRIPTHDRLPACRFQKTRTNGVNGLSIIAVDQMGRTTTVAKTIFTPELQP
jgi:hypothetical protein